MEVNGGGKREWRYRTAVSFPCHDFVTAFSATVLVLASALMFDIVGVVQVTKGFWS